MGTNDFLAFGGGGSANVIDQPTYAALAARLTGFQSGTAQSAQLNKVWRQSSIVAAVVAQFIVNQTGQSATDDGTTATLLSNLATAVAVSARQNPVLADTGTANTYVVANMAAFPAYPTVSGLVIDVSIANANTGASTLNVDGLGSKPIYGLALQPLQGSELIVRGVACFLYVVASTVNSGNGAWVLMECAGGAQQIAPAVASQHAVQLGQVRQRLSANTNFYVNASTGSDSNNGLTAGTAWATISKALTVLQQNYDLAGFTATINVAAGSYAPGVVTGSFVGAIASNSVQIVAAGAVTVTNPSGGTPGCFYATGGAQFAISGSFTLVNNNSGASCAQASGSGSILNIGAGLTVGFSAGSHFLANAGGVMNINANYAIANSGGAGSHYNVANAGILSIASGITVTVGTGVGITLAFAAANGLSQITSSGVTYSGSAVTGTRYVSNTNSIISTNRVAQPTSRVRPQDRHRPAGSTCSRMLHRKATGSWLALVFVQTNLTRYNEGGRCRLHHRTMDGCWDAFQRSWGASQRALDDGSERARVQTMHGID